jgi:hypothetical protein
MSNSGDDFSAEISKQNNGITIYFIIQATDNKTETKQTTEYNYIVNNLPEISNVVISPENPTDNDAVVVSATITDSEGSISSAKLKWGTTSSSYPNSISMSNSGDEYFCEIPKQYAGSTVYFIIEATDNLSKQVDFSGNYSVSESTGINPFSTDKLKIYPNPVKETLFIEITNGEIIRTIKLYNVVGEKVYEASGINSSETSVNLNSFSNGIYFITVENSVERYVKKIILE